MYLVLLLKTNNDNIIVFKTLFKGCENNKTRKILQFNYLY